MCTRLARLYGFFATPWGDGRVAVVAGQLVRVELPVDGRTWLAEAQGAVAERGLDLAVDRWVEGLEAYFRGERLTWSEEEVPLEAVAESDFQRAVYGALLSVAPGTTISYGQLAQEAGFPGAARAVGQAMAANPVPVVIPCHRVVRSDGNLGGFGLGLSWKERLLAHEKRVCGERARSGVAAAETGWERENRA